MSHVSSVYNIMKCIENKELSIDLIDSVSLKITSKCNLDCSMCGFARNKAIQNSRIEDLPVEVWKDAIDKLSDFGVKTISLLGGEPLLYEGIIEIIKYIKQKDINIFITTNGVYLNYFYRELIDLEIARINISLDSFPETHDKIRGEVGCFNSAIDGIKKLSQYKKLEGKVSPEIIINVVISENNNYELYDYLNYLDSIEGIDGIFVVLGTFTTQSLGERYSEQLLEYFDTKANSWRGFVNCLGDINYNEVKKIYKKVKDKEFNKRVVLFPPLKQVDDIERYYTEPEKIFTWSEDYCWKPWYGFDILSDGEVIICSDWTDYPVGNIFTDTLEEIWNGNKIKKLRSYILDHKNFGVCSRCPWRYLPSFLVADPYGG